MQCGRVGNIAPVRIERCPDCCVGVIVPCPEVVQPSANQPLPGEFLIGEARILSGSSKYVDATSEMMKDTIDSSLHKLIPESTKINSVTVNDGIAKVDLSKNFVDDRFVSDTTDILLIYSIVNTLTEFSDVNSVEFYIDGTKLDVLGQLDLQEPYFRKSDLIKKD